MIRKGRPYKLEEVLQHAIPAARKKKKVEFDGDMIKVSSDRLFTFKSNPACCVCGLRGQYLFKEKHSSNDMSFHINMYAIDENGEELLMTKDHIVPQSLGGKNHPSNYQTMCIRCNLEKGNGIQRGTYLPPRKVGKDPRGTS